MYGNRSLDAVVERLVLRCVYRCEASYPGADGDSFSKVGLALPSTGVHEDVGIAHSGLLENVNLICLSPGEARRVSIRRHLSGTCGVASCFPSACRGSGRSIEILRSRDLYLRGT